MPSLRRSLTDVNDGSRKLSEVMDANLPMKATLPVFLTPKNVIRLSVLFLGHRFYGMIFFFFFHKISTTS